MRLRRAWAGMALVLGLFACAPPPDPPAAPPEEGPRRAESEAGIVWSVPARWRLDAPRPMRLRTYLVSGEGAQSVELVVSHFAGGGGDREGNLERWRRQFRSPDGGPPARVDRSVFRIGGLRVTMLELAGTYTPVGAAEGVPAAPRPDQALIGAIAEGPEGPVFFKLTGPMRGVEEARGSFTALVDSLRGQASGPGEVPPAQEARPETGAAGF